jgi:DNA modification methylase
MDVTSQLISSIKPYSKNAKKHPKEQVQQIADSIREFGMNQPLVVDKDNVLIVGHGRLEAAKLLGMTHVPVLTTNLTEEQAKSYRLADNKLNESDWDMKLVIEELRDLITIPNLVDLTGFSPDLVLENDEQDDDTPELGATTDTKIGDVFQLGEHTLVCGDATDTDTVQRLMGDVKADMIFTDPPYNINYKGRGEATSNTIMNDSMSFEAFTAFLHDIFKNYATIVKAGAGNYVFHSTSTQAQFEKAMNDNGFAIKNQLIWNKPMASMGWGDYRWKHEPFYYAGRKDVPTVFYGDRTKTTVWDFEKTDEELLRWVKQQKKLEAEGKTSVWTMKREPVQNYSHPTQKPVELIGYALQNSSKAGDVVVDFFGGSGATLIACQKFNRTCKTMELDPKYVDVIVSRFQKYAPGALVTKNGDALWK